MSWICSHCGERFPQTRARCPVDGSRVIADLDGRIFGGRYTVRELIGVGGMDSTVWKAWQTGTERAVAIKVLPPADEAAAKRFGRGARIAANLTHPNCLVIHDYGTSEDGHLYLVMELLKGKTLQDLLAGPPGGGPVATSVSDAIDIADQVLQALEHAHANRAVHRDLKPDNLYVTKRGDGSLHVKILDFGIAKYIEEDPTEPSTEEGSDSLEDLVTEQRQVCGTPQYMAPEQVVGGRVDARTDIYSLGVVLYRMLTGRLPFDGKTRFDLYQKHLQETPPPFREAARPGLEFPSRLELIIMRALAKSPNQRFQSAAEMRAALAEVDLGDLRGRTGSAPRVALKNTSPRHPRPTTTSRPVEPPPLPIADAPELPWRSRDDEVRPSEKKGLTLELGAADDEGDFAAPTLVLPDAPIHARRATVSVQAPVPAPSQTEPSSSEQPAPAPIAAGRARRRGVVAAVLIGAFLVGVGGVAGIMALVRSPRPPTAPLTSEVASDRVGVATVETAAGLVGGDDVVEAPAPVEPQEPDPVVDPPVEPLAIEPSEVAPEPPAAVAFEFQLDTVPRGAIVRLADADRDFGPTPTTVELPEGSYALTLTLDGHMPETVTIRLGPEVSPSALRRTVYLARRVDAPTQQTTPRPPVRRPRTDDVPAVVATDPAPPSEPRQPKPALLDDEPAPTPRKPRVDLLDGDAPPSGDRRAPKVDLLEEDSGAKPAKPKPRVDLLDD